MSDPGKDPGPPPEIQIRPYREGDAPLLVEAATESLAEIFPWLPWCHPGYTLGESEQWIRHCEATHREGTEYHFAVIDAQGSFLGGCGLNQLRLDHGVANLGYWVRTTARGRGIATHAVRLLKDFAFRETPLRRLEILAAVENVASQRAAERAGALREGVLRDRLFLHGRSHDAVMYSLVRGISAETAAISPLPVIGELHRIERLRSPIADADLRELATLLVEAVAEGSAVSFLAPLEVDQALAWWSETLTRSSPRTIVLVARGTKGIAGTVQVQPAWAPNQPYRGDVVKLLVRRSARRSGLGAQLMETLEAEARREGYRLLTLDTKRGDAAERLYHRLGWNEAGVIPGYALDPDGTPHDAVLFWKKL